MVTDGTRASALHPYSHGLSWKYGESALGQLKNERIAFATLRQLSYIFHQTLSNFSPNYPGAHAIVSIC